MLTNSTLEQRGVHLEDGQYLSAHPAIPFVFIIIDQKAIYCQYVIFVDNKKRKVIIMKNFRKLKLFLSLQVTKIVKIFLRIQLFL
jgi:hypothetical protein